MLHTIASATYASDERKGSCVRKSLHRYIACCNFDGDEGVNFDHIIYGQKILLVLIVNIMLVHGFSHNSMLVGTMFLYKNI